jgi:hypothetical protein
MVVGMAKSHRPQVRPVCTLIFICLTILQTAAAAERPAGAPGLALPVDACSTALAEFRWSMVSIPFSSLSPTQL